MPNITNARLPVWNDAAHSSLDIEVSMNDGGNYMPYTARPGDPIYSDAVAGKYGVVSEPAPPVPLSIAQLGFYARKKADKIHDGGISVDVGAAAMVQVDTTPDALAGYARNLQLAALNPSQTFNWVQASGTISLSVAQMQSIARAAYAFEQNVWTTLGTLTQEINSGQITTTGQIDSFAWPAGS